MKALVKSFPKKGLWFEDLPKPLVGPNDVLIKVYMSAICGTDVHIYSWDTWAQGQVDLGRIVGHEYVGYVAEKGREVKHIKEGDRVTGEGHIACSHCRNCRRGKKHLCEKTLGLGVDVDGAFAEYVLVPATNVIKVNESIPNEVVSIMDPLGNAVHTAMSFPIVGEDVLITGAGLIGSMIISIAQHLGARHVVATELNEYRIALAGKMGDALIINPKKNSLGGAMKLLQITGFDVGFECSGAPEALHSMIKHMYRSGKISLLGIQPPKASVNWNDIIFNGLIIKGIYGREMFETWYQMEQLLLSGLDISPIITHRYNIDDFDAGFKLMLSGNCGKVILNWV